MKRIIFTLLLSSVIPALLFGQKKQEFLQKTDALLKNNPAIAEYKLDSSRGSAGFIRFAENFQPASNIAAVIQTYFTSRAGFDTYTKAKEANMYEEVHVERYQQYFKGIKVEFGQVVAVSKNGMLAYLNAENYIPEETQSTTVTLSKQTALANAITQAKATRYAWQDGVIKKEDGGGYPDGELVLMPDMRKGGTGMVLAWKFDIYTLEPLSREYVYISAVDGSVIFKNAILKHANATGTADTRYSGTQSFTTNSTDTNFQLKRTSTYMDGIETYDMHHGNSYTLATIPVDNDNNWSQAEYDNANKDNAMLDAHWGAEQVVKYWKGIHGRNSFDGEGARVKSYTHCYQNYSNAFWDGSVMTYGDGNGTSYNPFPTLDVCAHEIGHAVCQYTSDLVYNSESGGMNEGFSDIWGACLENYVDPANTTYEHFLIGEQVRVGWIKGINRTAIRDMAFPKTKGSPDTYGGQYWTGGADVHYMSGVLNKWFHLLTAGESGINDLGNTYNVIGLGFSKSEKIAFLTESSLTPNATYSSCRAAAISAAITLYGGCSQEVISTTNAWNGVGVGAEHTSCGAIIQFTAAGATVSENVAASNCRGSKTTTATIIMHSAPAQNVTVALQVAGNAKINRDYTLSATSFTFTPGGPTRKDLIITTYDNAIDEGDRDIDISYTITGPALRANANQEFNLLIKDNDALLPVGEGADTYIAIVTEEFSGDSLPPGWLAGSGISPKGANFWTVGPNAAINGSGSAYITNNATNKPHAYNKSSTSNAYLLSPQIDGAGLSGITLSFNYFVGGDLFGNAAEDYGSIVYTLDDGPTIFNYPSIQFVEHTTISSFTLKLPDSIFSNHKFRLGVRWRNDNSFGSDPPMAIDRFVIGANRHLTPVETVLNASRSNYVEINSTTSFYTAAKKIIARISNATDSIGCINTVISQAGTGRKSLWVGGTTYARSAKVITLTPTLPNDTVHYRLAVYFTNAELAAWGTDRLQLKLLAVKAGADLDTIVDPADVQLINPVQVLATNGTVLYSGEFTGFSQVMLVNELVNCGNANTLYVDGSKAEGGDGLSWGTAYKTLYDALDFANLCTEVKVIKVAKGTYYPTSGTSRDSSFLLQRNGLKLYGGYPAGGDTIRNPADNPTILSGNIGNTGGTSGNSYHIMVLLARANAIIDTATRIDGFSFTGGHATSSAYFNIGDEGIYQDNGAAIHCNGIGPANNCSPAIVNCKFYNNRANNRGGAIFNEGYNGGKSSPLIVNCTFYNNTAGFTIGAGNNYGGGGAVFNNGPSGTSSPSIINCSFASNNANLGIGGAISNYDNSNPRITNCIVYGNTAGANTSNIGNDAGATATVRYSLVQGGYTGTGNFNTSPSFVNTGAGNLQLQACSPAINRGDSTALPLGLATDLLGEERIFNATVDMGAYECRLLPTIFTFTGTGNWNTVVNWQCNWTPPSPLPAGSEVVVNPASGDCILNVPFRLVNGGKLTVKTGKKLIIPGGVLVQ
ncbi:MAG: M4 family metallopeptidase [Bacteroidota bacterium]